MTAEVIALPHPDDPIAVPAYPQRSWFTDVPDWFDWDSPAVQAKIVGPEAGRVAVFVAPADEGIIGGVGARPWYPPRSRTGYEYAHCGTTVTSDGETIRTANIGKNVNHVPGDPNIGITAAADHYANTAARVMSGRYQDHKQGIVFLGALCHGQTVRDALHAMQGSVSGDWRWVDKLRSRELAGAQLVNSPAMRRTPKVGAPAARYAVVASLSGALVGHWRTPIEEAFDRVEALEAVIASLRVASVPDIELL